MEDENVEQKILKKMYAWMVAGGVVIGSVGATGVVRYDKYGASDAELMRNELIHYTNVQVFNIKKSMPPPDTRARIRAIENCLESNCDNFETPTQDW